MGGLGWRCAGVGERWTRDHEEGLDGGVRAETDAHREQCWDITKEMGWMQEREQK